MYSFSSTLNESGNYSIGANSSKQTKDKIKDMWQNVKNNAVNSFKNSLFNSSGASWETDNLTAINLNMDRINFQELLKQGNYINKSSKIYDNEIQYGSVSRITDNDQYKYYTNDFIFTDEIIADLNGYDKIYNKAASSLYEAGLDGDDTGNFENGKLKGSTNEAAAEHRKKQKMKEQWVHTPVRPSLFNRYMGVRADSITQGIGLILNDADVADKINGLNINLNTVQQYYSDNNNKDATETRDLSVKLHNTHALANLGNCSVSELVRLSRAHYRNGVYVPANILTHAAYSFSDFMFARDVGKIPNNRLITLRKFSTPVGDNIFHGTKDHVTSEEHPTPETARLVTWFDNGDNKLEDILKYDYEATWKLFESKIQELSSQEDDGARGPLGAILNTLNPSYNRAQRAGRTGTHNLISMFLGHVGLPDPGGPYQNISSMYDKNRIYEPQNTIQETHKYEGKLKFNQEFTLIFSYRMRAYQNINTKSAMLDLLANILEVTYRRGKFWGGERRMTGAPQNGQGWKKAMAMIDNAWDKLVGFGSGLLDGSIDINAVMSQLAESASEMLNKIVGKGKEMADDIVNKGGTETKEAVKAAGEKIVELNNKYHFTDALKGALQNQLGRPAVYCFDSLLTGGPVGLWHLTIGNPKNPIMTIGNLILTKSSIQQFGALGIDDFPSEIKVSVTLKHGRPRDLTEISRMYTRGVSGIYYKLLNYSSPGDWLYGSAYQNLNAETDDKDEAGKKMPKFVALGKLSKKMVKLHSENKPVEDKKQTTSNKKEKNPNNQNQSGTNQRSGTGTNSSNNSNSNTTTSNNVSKKNEEYYKKQEAELTKEYYDLLNLQDPDVIDKLNTPYQPDKLDFGIEQGLDEDLYNMTVLYPQHYLYRYPDPVGNDAQKILTLA